MPKLTVPSSIISVEVSCQECGMDLTTKIKKRGGDEWIEVQPCPTCLRQAREDGIREGEESAAR